ncbi:50S ribosomal protein L22 [Roseibacillus ishigakijimensis]|uniref:Large ribosomal subunit protein uL22 n=1 Tax=Roseibacillus ishigakijimensis TaxID=454146 RepID=A0A934VLH0_9BACT|nr:50S ribosomal protein L22 [Roseibacillus ishigakijimensis]MBK1834679.1 50S ribosomal protein L22 [Roseibacillus ishigakijimensis]
MEVRAIHKYARISAKKARDVAREIQGLPVSDALDTLAYTPKKAAFLIGKTLKSAVANAENNHEMVAETMVVKEAHVTDGPTSRRFKPRARGSAAAIRKRTSHIYITLAESEEEEVAPKPRRAAKKAAPQQPAAEEAAPAAAEVDKEKLGLVYDEAPAESDDLKKISGVGPALEAKLHGFGVYTYQQIIDWTPENIAAFDELLSFKGRIERDNWQDQAKTLQSEKGGEA